MELQRAYRSGSLTKYDSRIVLRSRQALLHLSNPNFESPLPHSLPTAHAHVYSANDGSSLLCPYLLRLKSIHGTCPRERHKCTEMAAPYPTPCSDRRRLIRPQLQSSGRQRRGLGISPCQRPATAGKSGCSTRGRS